ncbi:MULTISPECIES: immunoglobulin-like domain-containing protein [Bacillus]|uniref:immunoglobulin-like domain-containing protein n=1 Tax=Bacillus TaxID=1386 RepID=UPI0003189676|nr:MULTISPECIES: immunoglobulin-like domain-containing protein [Bacillus]
MLKKYFSLGFLLGTIILVVCSGNVKTETQSMVIEESEETLVKATEQELLSSNNGISIKTEKEQYKTTDNEITVNFQNESQDEFTYGEGFYLERNINGTWYSYPFKEDIAVIDTGYTLQLNEKKSKTCLLSSLKEKLVTGEYRVIQSFGATYVAAPFEVIKE